MRGSDKTKLALYSFAFELNKLKEEISMLFFQPDASTSVTQNTIQEEKKWLVVFDWDSTLATVDCDGHYKLIYPEQTELLLGHLHAIGVHLAIATASKLPINISDCLDREIGTNREFLKLSEDKKQPRGIYSPVLVDESVFVEGKDFKVCLIEKIKRDRAPSIPNDHIIFADDSEEYREAASKEGITCIDMQMTKNDEVPPVAYLSAIAELTLLQQGIDKTNSLRNLRFNPETMNAEQYAENSYLLYKSAESSLDNAMAVFKACNDVVRQMCCHMALADLYSCFHEVNKSVPQEALTTKSNYYDRRILVAVELFELLKDIKPNNYLINENLWHQLRNFFNTIITQLGSYENPKAQLAPLLSDIKKNYKYTLDDLYDNFKRATQLQTDLTLPEPKSKCLVM
jgi:hypothetical protein